MSLHRRRTVFGACLIVTATLLAAPVCANPADYRLELVRVGPGKSNVTIRLLRVKPTSIAPAPSAFAPGVGDSNREDEGVTDAVIRGAALMGQMGTPMMTVPMRGVPAAKPGYYTFKVEPGMEVFELEIEAAVPGESETVGAKLVLKSAN